MINTSFFTSRMKGVIVKSVRYVVESQTVAVTLHEKNRGVGYFVEDYVV